MSSLKNGANRKRNKKFYCDNSKKKRRLEELEQGMTGFLITCNDREAPAVSEAYCLLNEYADKLYGPEKASEDAEKNSEEEDNVEKSLSNEIKDLKDRTTQRRFKSVKTKVKNVIFIKTTLPDPNDLVSAIFTDLEKSKIKKTRRCMKFFPILLTCHASLKAIQIHAKKVFEDFFQSNRNEATYCIVFKSRCNNSVKRDDVIPDMSEMIRELNEDWTVQYKNPEYTVNVDIIGNVCSLAILKDFDRFRKYNLQSITETEEKQVENKEKASEKIVDQINEIEVKTELSDELKEAEKVSEEDKTKNLEIKEIKLEDVSGNDSEILSSTSDKELEVPENCQDSFNQNPLDPKYVIET